MTPSDGAINVVVIFLVWHVVVVSGPPTSLKLASHVVDLGLTVEYSDSHFTYR